MGFPDDVPLGDARQWLRERVEEGAVCPCCTQFAKVYTRPLNSGMARSLIEMYRIAGMDWVHIPTAIGARSREEGKMRYWDLVEDSGDIRPDGGRAGWWRVTPHGARFVLRQIKVQKYARIYDDRLLNLKGNLVDIQDVLGTKFDLRKLMRGE